MKESLVLSPTNASQAGYHVHVDPKTGKKIELDALLDDMSLQAMAEQRAFYAHWRERFRTETPLATLGPQDAADWQLIDDQIGLNLLEFDQDSKLSPQPDRAGRADRQRALSSAHANLRAARCAHRPRPLARAARCRACSIR